MEVSKRNVEFVPHWWMCKLLTCLKVSIQTNSHIPFKMFHKWYCALWDDEIKSHSSQSAQGHFYNIMGEFLSSKLIFISLKTVIYILIYIFLCNWSRVIIFMYHGCVSRIFTTFNLNDLWCIMVFALWCIMLHISFFGVSRLVKWWTNLQTRFETCVKSD